jgi:hypothetical protein
MAELAFDPASLGATPVDSAEFDPSSLGATPVESTEEFDPSSLGATEVEAPQTFGDKSSRFLASAASQGINTIAGATRTFGALQPQLKAVFDEVAKSTGLATTEEFLTELQGASERAKDDYGVDPKQNNSFLSSLAEGAGSLLPTLASGPFAPYTTALSMGESGYQEAEAAGGSELQKTVAGIGNAATGFVTEKLLGVPALLKSAAKTKLPQKTSAKTKLPQKTFKNLVASITKQMGLSFAREGTQETLEQISQDAIAAYISAYDPERKVFDGSKLAKTFLAGGILGSAMGGLIQAAVETEAPTKVESQTEAENIDRSLEETALAQPPPLPTQPPPLPADAQAIRSDAGQVPEVGAVAQESPIQSGENIQQPAPGQSSGTEVPQPEVAPKVSPHTPQKEGESIVSTAIQLPSGEVITGKDWNSPHASMLMEALDKGLSDTDYQQNLGFVIQDEQGNQRFASREEALEMARRTKQVDESKLTANTKGLQSEGLIPIEQAPKITQTQAAETLQPFFNEAVEVARKAGASDPEAAASQAQIELSRQVEEGKTTLDNPRALLMEASRRQAGKQKAPVAEAIEAPEATTQRGPRAESISEEDVRSIETAINRLPDTQRRVMQALTENPELTDQELADEAGLTLDQAKKAKRAARQSLRDIIEEQGIGLSMGPGAASASEVLASYELRKFGKRFQETEEIAPEVKAATGDRYYEPIPNQVTAKRATELIEERGEEEIEKEIRDESSSVSFADRNTVGQILIKKYNERYKSLKESNPEDAEKVLTKAAELAEWSADFGTRLGQGVQSFAMWMRLTPEGKLRTFKRMVDKKRKEYTRNNRGDIDQIKDILNGEGTDSQKVERVRKLKSPTAKKIKKKVGKILQGTKTRKVTDKDIFDNASDLLGLPVYSTEVAKEILRLGTLIDAAPEGMPKMEATLELNKYLAQQRGFDPSDLLFGMYYGNILSGGGTQAINFVDTTLNVINEVTTLALQNPKAFLKIASGLAKGFGTGKADFLMALMKGRRISDGKLVEDPFLMEIAEFGKKGGVPIKTGGIVGRTVKRIAESKIAYPLRFYKFISRAMSASDALAFRGAQEAKAAQLAYKMANEAGGDTSATMDRLLGYDRLTEFRKQAESEGYKGAQQDARVTELMIMSRPEEIQRASRDFASEATYNVKPYGLMGAISNRIESFTKDYKIGKLVVPFTRIVGNVMNRGLNNSPWGYVRSLRGEAGAGLSKRVFSPEERNALLIRATVSTALMATVVALHEAGVLTIHGAGPSDPEKKKQLKQAGWKPYTIQVGDKYIGYTFTPWGLMMAATGNWLDNDKYQDFSSKEGLDKFTYSAQSVASTMFNQSFLSGLSTLFDVIAGKSPAQQIAAGKRFVANTVAGIGIPFASALKDIEAIATEPNIPRVDSIRQAIIASIPFASQGLQPQLNALGEPVKSVRNRFFSSATDDPVWKMVYEKGLRVPVPNNFFDNPQDQYEYVEKQGKALRKWIEANLGRLNAMSTEDAQDAIENASDSFRQRERNRMLIEGRRKKEKR